MTDPAESVHATLIETPPGYLLARTSDGREVRLRRITLEARSQNPLLCGMPLVLGDIRPDREGVAWAHKAVLDEERRAEYDALLAVQTARLKPPPITRRGVITAVDGKAALVRLDSGEEYWFRTSRCRDYRGHLGIAVEVAIAPAQVASIEIAPEDRERNAELCRALEPKPLAPIKFRPSR